MYVTVLSNEVHMTWVTEFGCVKQGGTWANKQIN